ncbi:MAG: ribonuclease PH [Acidobacteriia bacterium]|nr:ribonuclease PH [Terriglobia bacterium]
MARHDGRGPDELRPVTIEPGYLRFPDGSVLISVGDTRVVCAATLEDKVPPFLKDTGQGWVTGEYAMIPAATHTRSPREINRGRPAGRTMEIQRLIGRALRSVVDRTALGERTLWIDCDVIQADGGTRTAGITGGFVAMCLALDRLREKKALNRPVLTGAVAAISVGIVEGEPALDLDYIEDSAAEVDMNVVRTDDGRYVEIQGTAESTPFRRDRLGELLTLADQGIDRLQERQREALGGILARLLIRR